MQPSRLFTAVVFVLSFITEMRRGILEQFSRSQRSKKKGGPVVILAEIAVRLIVHCLCVKTEPCDVGNKSLLDDQLSRKGLCYLREDRAVVVAQMC